MAISAIDISKQYAAGGQASVYGSGSIQQAQGGIKPQQQTSFLGLTSKWQGAPIYGDGEHKIDYTIESGMTKYLGGDNVVTATQPIKKEVDQTQMFAKAAQTGFDADAAAMLLELGLV